MVIKIIDNIQLSLKNIHIRIEETESPFKYSMGFTLKEVSGVSTNAQWVQTFIEREPNQLHFFKLLNLVEFGFYLNANETQFTDSSVASSQFNLNYLISPMSLIAKMTKNNKPKEEGIEAAYQAEVSLDCFGIALTRQQYNCIITILNDISSYRKFQMSAFNRRKYLYFKPQTKLTIKGNEKNINKWFKYSIEMIRRQIKFLKGNMKAFDIEESILEEYKAIFQDKFIKMMTSGKDPEDVQFKHIVQSVNIEILISWLGPIIEVVYKEKAFKEKKGGFFSNWFSSNNKENELTKEEQANLETILNELMDQKFAFNQEAFLFQYNLMLNKGWIKLLTNNESCGDSSNLSFSSFKFVHRSYNNRLEMNAELKTLEIAYYQQLKNLDHPITKKELSKNKRNEDDSIITMTFVNYYASSDYDTELSLKLLPQDIIFNHYFFEQIREFFKVNLEEHLLEEAYSDLTQIYQSSQRRLQQELTSKHKIDIQILERCLYIPIQKENVYESEFLVFNLGQLMFFSPLKNSVISGIKDDSYLTKFILNFSSIGLSYYSSYENIIQAKEGVELFNNLSGSVNIKQSHNQKLKEGAESQPQRLKLEIDFCNMNMAINEYHYSILISLGEVFSLNQSVKDNQSVIVQDEMKKKTVIGLIYLKSTGLATTWIPYWGVFSDGFLYFYKDKDSIKPVDTFYLKGCVFFSVKDNPNCLKIKKILNSIEVQFPSQKELSLFLQEITVINILNNKGNIYAMDKDEEFSEAIFFEGQISIQMLSCSFTDTSHPMKPKYTIQIENNTVLINVSQRRTEILLSVNTIKVINENQPNPSFATVINTNCDNHQALDFIMVKIIIDKKTSQKDINLQLGYLNIKFQPKTINHFITVLTSKPYYMNEDAKRENDETNPALLGLHSHITNCISITHGIRITAEMKSINIIFIQPKLLCYFFECNVEKGVMIIDMLCDHFTIQGSVGNAELYDLTNYPFTIKSQAEYREEHRQKIFGSKENTSSLIDFNIRIYQPTCPLFKDKISGDLDMSFSSVFLIYTQEEFLRILNFMISEIVPSFSDKQQSAQFKKNNVKLIEARESYGNLMKINIKLTNPQLILKPRPASDSHFLFDFGMVRVTNAVERVKGRIIHLPAEERVVQIFQLSISGGKIQTNESFILSDHIDGTLNIITLSMKQEDYLFKKEQIDSHTGINFSFAEIELKLRQRDFTEIMRCFDLNLLYNDILGKEYEFTEFRSESENTFNSQLIALNDPKAKKTSIVIKGFFDFIRLKLLVNDKVFSEFASRNMYFHMESHSGAGFHLSFNLGDILLLEYQYQNKERKTFPLQFNQK